MNTAPKKNFVVFISSLKMASATLLSRIMGLVREQVMAALFGASGLTDAFLVAYRIPNLMRDLFAEGAFSAAFVPTFIKAREESEESAKNLLWALFFLLLFVTGALSLGIFVFAEEFILLFAPSFTEVPQKFEIAVNLTKLMAPYFCFICLAALYMGALNSLKVFFLPSLAPVFFNISMIASMLFLPSWFESIGQPAVYALGIGVLVGGFLQGAIQLPALIGRGYSFRKPEKILTSKSKRVFKLLGPGLIGFAATQLNLIVTTVLASSAAVGAVSWLSYSFRLFQLPVGILSVSIGNSNLVHFSESLKKNRKDEAIEHLSSSYLLSWFVILPALVISYFYSEPIVSLVFQRGAFGANDTKMTALALSFYAIGLPFYSLVKLFVPAAYALNKHKMAVISSITSIIGNIVFCLLFVPKYGFSILAVGTTLSMFINAKILGITLRKELALGVGFFFSIRWFKLIIAAVLSSFSTLLFKKMYYSGSQVFWENAIILIIGMFIVAFSYIMALYLLGEREIIDQLFSKLKRKLGKKR